MIDSSTPSSVTTQENDSTQPQLPQTDGLHLVRIEDGKLTGIVNVPPDAIVIDPQDQERYLDHCATEATKRLLSAALSGAGAIPPDGRYIVRIEDGKLDGANLVPDNACVIDPSDENQMVTMLRECVPPAILSAVIAKLGASK